MRCMVGRKFLHEEEEDDDDEKLTCIYKVGAELTAT